MRYYFPESPKFRFFLQKQDCHKLTISAPMDMSREAPKSKADSSPTQEVKQAAAKTPPRPGEGAHRALDQIKAVQDWWAKPLPFMQPATPRAAASASPASKVPPPKPLETLDLQDVPATLQANGYKLDPALMRLWFGNQAYAVQSKEQKDSLPGAPFYPANLVDTTMLNMAELRKLERIQAAFEKIKSPEFLSSKPVRDALHKVCTKLRQGYGYDVKPEKEFKGDLQKMHRRYAFASITIGKRFPQSLDDIKVKALDKSAGFADDVELALGAFKIHVAISDAHVHYNGRFTRRVNIKELAIYVMAPYGFDAFEPVTPYLGHFNKKHFALVTDDDWVNAPVYAGKDMYAKNAVLRPVSKPMFLEWRQRHNKGGDMLLFSDRWPSSVDMNVEIPIRNTVSPYVAAHEVLNALQRSAHGTDYTGRYQFQLEDFGEYATAGTKLIDRIGGNRYDGIIRLNLKLFSEVSADNIELLAGAVAHETRHQHQSVIEHLRDSLPVVGQNTWHDQLDEKALADSASVLDEIKTALGL